MTHYPFIKSLAAFDREYYAEWRFEVGAVTVLFAPAYEHEPPDFEDKRDNKFACEGGAHWFMATVLVYVGDELVAWDTLGGCSYHSYEEFTRGHLRPRNGKGRRGRYVHKHHGLGGTGFTDMVREAIREARRTCAPRREGLLTA